MGTDSLTPRFYHNLAVNVKVNHRHGSTPQREDWPGSRFSGSHGTRYEWQRRGVALGLLDELRRRLPARTRLVVNSTRANTPKGEAS